MMKITISPYDPDHEKVFFYSGDESFDIKTGCIGHLRGDFGRGGTEFWTTFSPHQPDLISESFKQALNCTVDTLREKGRILASLFDMREFCRNFPSPVLSHLDEADRHYYHGYRIECSNGYTFMLRVFFWDTKDYNFYLYGYETAKLNQFIANYAQFYCGMKKPEWRGLSDCMRLEWNDQSGFTLYLFWNKVSTAEIREVSTESDIDIRFLPINDISFFCFKFGNLPWADCPFSPHIYDEHPLFDKLISPLIGYSLSVFLIDTSNGELKYIRQIGLGHEFSNLIRVWAKKSLENKTISKEDYIAITNNVYQKYTSNELAEKATLRYMVNS